MSKHLASYTFDGYRLRKTEGSAFRTANAVRQLRSIRGSLALSRRMMTPVQELVRRVRDGENPTPETELPSQIMSFLRGSQSGDVSLSFGLTLTDDELSGRVSGTFRAEGLTIDLQTRLPDEEAVRTFVRDMLCILFQYNIGVESIVVDIQKSGSTITANGEGLLEIPPTLEEDQTTLRALARTRLFRDLVFTDD